MKNLRGAQPDQRTNGEGKHVANKVLLAMPDNEYELMRPDLTYIDLQHHLSLHEPTQKVEFVYFPNRGMVSQVVVTQRRSNRGSGCGGERGLCWRGISSWLEQKFSA